MKKIAHRGATDYYPENTLEAFNKAIELGYDGIECDVRRLSDGELVLMHDSSINRTTNGNGDLNHLSGLDLQMVAVGNRYKVPTVAQVIEHILPRTWVNFELKEADKRAAREIAAQVPPKLRNRVLISSKHAVALTEKIPISRGFIHPFAWVAQLVARKQSLDAIITRSWFINRFFLKKTNRRGLEVFLYHPLGTRIKLTPKDKIALTGLITDEIQVK